MLSSDELDQLAADLLDLIEERAADLVAAAPSEQDVLTAALEVDAGLREVGPRVTRALDERARRAGMSYAAIGAARGTSRQAVHERVRGR